MIKTVLEYSRDRT